MTKTECVKYNSIGECIEFREVGEKENKLIIIRFKDDARECNPELYQKWRELNKVNGVKAEVD